ncbi:MAG: hypothetical protein BWX82_00258 [Parcubacteria group bacterium ADurb.Bin115]|nr:MAG: hypothetical protein BWX82_00258 [Parcubacteria group bacterium ADurb.Bin115]
MTIEMAKLFSSFFSAGDVDFIDFSQAAHIFLNFIKINFVDINFGSSQGVFRKL